jgi:hypothetical protein
MSKDLEKKRKRQKEKEKKKQQAQLKAMDKSILVERSKIGRNRLVLLFLIIAIFAFVVFYNLR